MSRSVRQQPANGSAVDITLPRDPAWIADCGAHVGGTDLLDLPELSAVGPAEVLATGEDALGKLKSLRLQDVERGHRASPETAAQRDFIHAWCDTWHRCVPAPVAPAAALLDCHDPMETFRGVPFGGNRLTATESALSSATCEIRRLPGAVNENNDRLARLYNLLVDGVLRSVATGRGESDRIGE